MCLNVAALQHAQTHFTEEWLEFLHRIREQRFGIKIRKLAIRIEMPRSFWIKASSGSTL